MHLLWSILNLTSRNRYPRKILLAVGMALTLVDLFFYYFTSKAFGKAFGSQNYFEYIIWGELVVALPINALLSAPRTVRASLLDGTWEILLSHPAPMNKLLFTLSVGEFLHALARVALILVTVHFMGAQFASALLTKAALTITVGMPLFWNLGLVASSAFIVTGRGLSLFQQLGSLATIAAGTYFPLTVLPEWLARLSLAISPLTLMLESTRSPSFDSSSLILLTTLSLVSLALGPWLLQRSLQRLSRTGSRLILS